jgi:5-methylcytosine-specific restriction endonuclease McrA
MARFIQRKKTFTLDELPGLYFPWYTRMAVELWRPLRQHVYQRDNGRCCYCGQAVELFTCHIHHVLELSQSGTNHPMNLKTLCVPCHEKRHPHMQDAVKRWV